MTYPRKVLNHLAGNHTITIATFRYSKELPQESKDGEITVQRLPYLLRISKGFFSPQSWFRFISAIGKADIVIVNIPNFEALPLAVFAKIMQKPIVAIFHCRVDLGKGYIHRLITAGLNFSVFGQLWLSKVIVIYTRDYFNHLGLEKRFSHKTRVVLPAVRSPKVDQQILDKYLKEKEERTWIGFAGRVSKEKGIHHLINAMDTLADHNKKLVLVIAGPYGDDVVGESRYYEEILSLLARKRVPCTFLGKLSGGDLGAFYRAIDLLVLPSVNQTEAFGMVQIDAMLSGKPVVASNLPGVRVPVNLSKMGLIVEPGDEKGISTAIEKIIADPQMYCNAELWNNAKMVFSDQRTYDFYERILEEMTNE
ncbi:MAG: glycosyltransferase family 4 protein [Desulfopila sp.]|nr:glycosyltransferase family 4 protein [Desulfopila sp.]